MKKGERKTDRYTKFSAILYEEDVRCKEIIDAIKEGTQDGFCILHDKDEAKPHYHTVYQIKNGKTISAFRKSMGEIGHLFQAVDNEDGLVIYFEHSDKESIEAGKKPYDIKNGFGSLAEHYTKLRKQLKNKLKRISTQEEAKTIADFCMWLDANDKMLSIRSVVDLALAGGWYDVLRRNWSIVASLCKEHNESFDRKQVFESALAQDISERIMETWTNALGVKMQFAEVNPKLIAEAEAAKLEYQASLDLLNEAVRSMISS